MSKNKSRTTKAVRTLTKNQTLQKRFGKMVSDLAFDLLKSDVPAKVFLQDSDNTEASMFDFSEGTCDVVITVGGNRLVIEVKRYE